MAKLGTYYGLCPLIDQRSLLGIVKDVTPGHVIVTLGKNIAIKYKLSDQKQINSWRTKDKFTSAVVYDQEEKKYAAAFNQSYIRLWNEDEENLDKQKKFKLKRNIHSILQCGLTNFVVFNNGAIHHLNTAIENRKDLDPQAVIDEETEYIADLLYTIVEEEIYIGQLIVNKEKDSRYFLWSIYGKESNEEIHKIQIQRADKTLVGYCFGKADEKLNVILFTLWSDGKLFSYTINENLFLQVNQEKSTEPPGNLTAIINSLSCDHFVTMSALNEHYIGMYGAATNEEGATLNIYNLQFKVTQTRQPFKMFTNGAKLWQIEDNILLSVGQNLAVIPFHLDTERLAALVGSHKIARTEKDPDVSIVQNMQVAVWDAEKVIKERTIPERIKVCITDLLEQGWPESAICEEVVPQLIEKEDLNMISDSIIYFAQMPESCIIKILKFILNANQSKFEPDNKVPKYPIPDELKPFQRCRFIDLILNIQFTDTYLINQIRKGLDFNESLLMLTYITYMLQEDSHSLPAEDETTSERKLIEWGSVLLDASYVKFLLTKDESVYPILNKFSGLVKEHLECMEQMRQALPIVSSLKNRKYNKNIQNVNMPYSIELLSTF